MPARAGGRILGSRGKSLPRRPYSAGMLWNGLCGLPLRLLDRDRGKF